MKSIFAVCVLLLVFAVTSFAQDFDYDRYKSRTLAEIIDLNNPKLDAGAKKQMMMSGKFFDSRVRVKYIGTSRPLSPERKEILNAWKTTHNIKPEIVALFEKEFLFKECEKEYWLPVQKQVAEFFPKELKEGEMITLYLIYGGGLKTPERADFLFLVNEFEK